MERDASGIQYADPSFCPSESVGQSRLLATAVSARVDIYSLMQSTEAELDDDMMGLKPTS